MTEPLYSRDILRLATETIAYPRLVVRDATVTRRSATCGSTISVDVMLDATGHVTGYGHDVRACALGQAASTLLARRIVGFGPGEVARARDRLLTYLEGEDSPPTDWPEFALLARARAYSARHPSIRLAFEAAAEAVESAAQLAR